MRIGIVGAGIAGLTTALCLSGAGHEIVVLERRTGFGETGAGIQLSPNASGILLALGLGPALARTAVEPDEVIVRSLRSGREIARVRLGALMRERHGAPYLSIARADLHTVLLDAVRSRPDIHIRVGRASTGAAQDAETATLSIETSGGAQASMTADLVVGADGLWSRIRQAIGDDRQPSYSGYAAYRATLPIDAVPADIGRHATGLWLGPKSHVVHYPIQSGRLANVVVVARREQSVQGWSEAAEAARVLAAITAAPRSLVSMIRAAEAWSAWSLFDLPVRALGRGRVALVGDAGHPVLPYLAQGGSLAIEDAAHLAAILRASGGNVRSAVAWYGRERLARVRRVQGEARRNGRVYHAGAPVSMARDLVMRRLGPEGMSGRYAWLYGWRPPEPTLAA